jgi:nucleotide-binding universal stress UspA family protein
LFKNKNKNAMETTQNQTQKTFESTPVKKILIAIDYNAYAQKVAEAGYSLAKSLNAQVVLLHSLVDDSNYTALDYNPVMGYGDFNHVYYHGMIDKSDLRKSAQYFLDKVKEYLNDASLQTIIEEGDAADTTIKIAEKNDCDIIVVGSHSRRWIEQVVMGQVTERILRRTDRPVFIVPTGNVKR